jgi:putative alpha-1,2-mannosidase
MKRPVKRLFQGFYIDAYDANSLVFVANEDCDKEAEFKKAYLFEYGEAADRTEILSVNLVSSVYHNGVEKKYRIQLVEK